MSGRSLASLGSHTKAMGGETAHVAQLDGIERAGVGVLFPFGRAHSIVRRGHEQGRVIGAAEDATARAAHGHRNDAIDLPARRVANEPPPSPLGIPEKAVCVDADGFLWNAEWAGWRLVRYSPGGQVDRIISMPMSRPSCCVFGGADYTTLFVTSAHYRMSAAEREQDPHAGSLYAVELGDVRGLPAHCFGVGPERR